MLEPIMGRMEVQSWTLTSDYGMIAEAWLE